MLGRLQRKVRGLTTMIKNLHTQLDDAERELAAIKQLQKQGKGDAAQIEERRQKLEMEIKNLRDKIEDKEAKLESANNDLQAVCETTNELETKKEQLRMEVDKVFRDYVEAARRTVGVNLAELMAEDAKARFAKMEKENPELLEYFDGGIIRDLADRGGTVLAVGAALFLGFTQRAVDFSASHGGNGGGVPSDWGRKDDEDDRAWSRRCLQQAAAMLRPAPAKKQKKSVAPTVVRRGRGRR